MIVSYELVNFVVYRKNKFNYMVHRGEAGFVEFMTDLMSFTRIEL